MADWIFACSGTNNRTLAFYLLHTAFKHTQPNTQCARQSMNTPSSRRLTSTTDIIPDAKPVDRVIGVIWPGASDLGGCTVATLCDGAADAGEVHLRANGCLLTLNVG